MTGWVDVLLQRGGGGGGLGMSTTILGLIVLIIDILVIVAVWKSRKTTMVKLVWTIVVLVLGPIGWILYFFLGREK
jgi:hypothetical protein